MGLNDDLRGLSGFEESDSVEHAIEREPMADETADLEAARGEEGYRSAMSIGVCEAPGDADLPAVHLMGGDVYASILGGHPEEQHATAFAGKIHGLLRGLATADAFDDDVGSRALGGVFRDLLEVLGAWIDDEGGPELLGGLSLLWLQFRHYRCRRALEQRELEQDEPYGPRADHKNDVARADAGPVYAMDTTGNGLGHGSHFKR